MEEELYEGTAKSIEGALAEECHKEAKEEGCKVEVVWQDGDSSSAKSVAKYHGEGKVFKSGGHVGRAHANNLKEVAKIKHKLRMAFSILINQQEIIASLVQIAETTILEIKPVRKKESVCHYFYRIRFSHLSERSFLMYRFLRICDDDFLQIKC